MKRTILTSIAIAAGALAGDLIDTEALHAQANGIPVSTFLQSDTIVTKDQKWKVITIELGPGGVDTSSVGAGTGLVYVLNGGGLLQLDGTGTIALRPGVAAAVNPQKPHVLKNTSETDMLRVLVVVHAAPGARDGKAAKKDEAHKAWGF
jgi:quercetin dioxygenase-like cupin family protein